MPVEYLKPVDFGKARPDYESRFPLEMGVLRVGGVYPGKGEITENPYTGEQSSEYFGNIGEHCLAVAFCAETIANGVLGENHPATGAIVSRALVHDATKGFEIMRRNAVKAGKIDDAYSPSAYETVRPLLEAQGVAPDVIDYMAHAGQETGHNSFPRFVVLTDGEPQLNTERSLAEMIVHHADDMTFSPIVKAGEKADSYYLTVTERQEASEFPKRYGFLYTEGFGFDEKGNVVMVKDVSQANPTLVHVKPLAEWHLWIADKVSAYLVSLMEPDAVIENPQQYLKDLVNARL